MFILMTKDDLYYFVDIFNIFLKSTIWIVYFYAFQYLAETLHMYKIDKMASHMGWRRAYKLMKGQTDQQSTYDI